MSVTNPLRLLLLGAPGSGKGTQSKKLLSQFPSMKSVSSGELLRQEISKGSKIGSIASAFIREGRLVPDELITKLVSAHVSTISPNWILDGFPRTITQAKNLSQYLKPLNRDLSLVVELDVPENVIMGRIQNRYIHLPSGRTYNLTYNPPKIPGKDDITGEPLVKRSDDNERALIQRLYDYQGMLAPLKEYYHDLGLLHTVSGDSSDVLYPQLLELIQNLLQSESRAAAKQ